MGRRNRRGPPRPPPTDDELLQYVEELREKAKEERDEEELRLIMGVAGMLRIAMSGPGAARRRRMGTRREAVGVGASGGPGLGPPPAEGGAPPTTPPLPPRTFESRIEELIYIQGQDLTQLQDAEAQRLLEAYEDARRRLKERLEGIDPDITPATAQRMRVTLAQVEAGIREMQDRLGIVLEEGERRMHEQALEDLIAVIRRAEPDFIDVGPAIEVQAAARLAETRGLLLHEHSLDRYGAQLVEEIQRRIVTGVVQGMSPLELAEEIAGADDSIFSRMRHRALLIARMELARAYDAGHQAALEAAADLDPPGTADPLLKMADEFFDRRNHPFSRLVHGVAVLPRMEFEVSLAGEAEAAKGLTWEVTNGVAHGFGYPAHFNDRGRQVPYRVSWDGGDEAWRPKTFRGEGLDEAVQRVAAGGDPEPDRRALELAGLIDGRGRLTLEGERRARPDGLHPTMVPNPDRVCPHVVPLDGRSLDDPAWNAEVRVADAMWAAGYAVMPVVNDRTKPTPDYVDPNGIRVDASRWGGARGTARNKLRDKAGRQADVVVLALEGPPDVAGLVRWLTEEPIDGLRELWTLDQRNTLLRVLLP